MAMFNIIDERSNEFNPHCDVVFEVFSDNWSDHGLPSTTKDFTEWVSESSIYSASQYAMRFAGCVTMYIYDPGMVTQEHNLLSAVHPKIKDKPLDVINYDPKLLRTF